MALSELAPGVFYAPGWLDRAGQEELLGELQSIVRSAPLFVPRMPRTGTPFSVRMTNCGLLGWVSDREGGYRYQPNHPETGEQWPPIPDIALRVWHEIGGYDRPPEACLINFYAPDARMGLHQDLNEADLAAPVVSLSLGETCRFRFGTTSRTGSGTQSFKLASGDAMALSGPARLIFHGVDKIYPGTSTLLKNGGRLNLTLRRVSARAE